MMMYQLIPHGLSTRGRRKKYRSPCPSLTSAELPLRNSLLMSMVVPSFQSAPPPLSATLSWWMTLRLNVVVEPSPV